MTDILIIRGAPGVGKSTVCGLLACGWELGVTIETDTIRKMVNNVNWTEPQEHIAAIIASCRLALSYLSNGYGPIVIADTLSGGTIKYITDEFKDHKYKIISLVANHDELKHRLCRRGSGFNDIDVSIWVNDDILSSDECFEFKIDTSELEVREVADMILQECQNV